jgi:hypothetical protein
LPQCLSRRTSPCRGRRAYPAQHGRTSCGASVDAARGISHTPEPITVRESPRPLPCHDADRTLVRECGGPDPSSACHGTAATEPAPPRLTSVRKRDTSAKLPQLSLGANGHAHRFRIRRLLALCACLNARIFMYLSRSSHPLEMPHGDPPRGLSAATLSLRRLSGSVRRSSSTNHMRESSGHDRTRINAHLRGAGSQRITGPHSPADDLLPVDGRDQASACILSQLSSHVHVWNR